MTKNNTEIIIGSIIAGGKSSRMGGEEKCLLSIQDKKIISKIIKILKPQVNNIIINANGDKTRFNFTNLPIIQDSLKSEGPLIGIYSALSWVKENIQNNDNILLACVPSDSPFIPENLIPKLKTKMQEENKSISCVSVNGRIYPIFCLIHISMLENLENAIKKQNIRAIYKWIEANDPAIVEFSDKKSFFNINTKEDLKTAIQLANS